MTISGMRPTRYHEKEAVSIKAKKITKLTVFFIVVGVISFILTVVSVTIKYYFGNQVEIYPGIFFDTSIFIATIIGSVVTPIITVFISRQITDVRKSMKT